MIASKQIYLQAKGWLLQLSGRYEQLTTKLEEFALCEDEIEAVYQEAQQLVVETRATVKKQFVEVKTELQATLQKAITETRLHALDSPSLIENSLASLLWYCDSQYIGALQLFTFKATCKKDNIASAFQIEVDFRCSDLQHLKIGQSLAEGIGLGQDSVIVRTETLELQKALEESRAKETILKQQNANLEEEIQVLKKTSETRYSELSDSNSRTTKLAIAELTERLKKAQQESADAEKRVLTTLEETKSKLELAEQKLSASEQRCSLLSQENVDLANQLILERAKKEHINAGLHGNKRVDPDSDSRSSAEPAPRLIAVMRDQVKIFDLETSQWKQLVALNAKIKVDKSSSSTLISATQVFVCGGYEGTTRTCHTGDSAYLLEGDGTVRQLGSMRTARRAPGITYDSTAESVYVFGGGTDNSSGYTGRLQSCEMFLFKSTTWVSMADMHQARNCFNPCWCSSIVYLCGGGHNSVETYNPQFHRFVLQAFTLQEDTSCSVVLEHGALTVISMHHLCVLQQARITSQQHLECLSWSNCTPVVVGGIVYIVNLYDDCCRGIDLATGTVTKEVRLK